MLSLFLSRNIARDSVLQELHQLPNIKLSCESLIEFNSLSFAKIDWSQYDIVFFGSRNVVHFLLNNESIPSHLTIACAGVATEKQLVNKGYTVDFVSPTGDLKNASKTFAEFCGTKKVLFPHSSLSLKTFAQFLPKENITEIEIYETLEREVIVEDKPDLLIFTSPSNVNAFLNKHEIHSDQRIIAWGESTEKSIINHDLNVFKTLKTPTEEELLKVVKEII